MVFTLGWIVSAKVKSCFRLLITEEPNKVQSKKYHGQVAKISHNVVFIPEAISTFLVCHVWAVEICCNLLQNKKAKYAQKVLDPTLRRFIEEEGCLGAIESFLVNLRQNVLN